MRYTEEHAYGYAVQLWRTKGSLIGLFMASAGLAGDTPTGRIEDVHYDPATGRIRFEARISMGTDARDRPTRDVFAFDGMLTGKGLIGEIAQSVAEGSSPPLKTRVMLRPATHEIAGFTSVDAWREWADFILEIRGPKWKPLDTYLRPEFVMKKASYPDQWHLPKAISPRQAIQFAVDALERRGVREIRICEIAWVVAPLGAAIIQATGSWKRSGSSFDTFVLGIRDGTEAKHGLAAGDEAYVVARGVGADRKEMYYTSLEKGGHERVLEYGTEEAVDDVLFEFVSREELKALPNKCNPSPSPKKLGAGAGPGTH